MARRIALEICVEGLDGVRAAQAGGADRVELCAALAVGGITPPIALVEAAVALGLPVHAMVRLGVGGFAHDREDARMVEHEIALLRRCGVDGVVVGALTAAGELDGEAMARWRQAAGDMAVTLHRAIDLARSPVDAVAQAAAYGVDHVLTSGGAASAMAGAETIAAMVRAAEGRLSIMAGGGVSPANAASLLAATKADALHASASIGTAWSDARIAAFGFGETEQRVTDVTRVAAIRGAINGYESTNEVH